MTLTQTDRYPMQYTPLTIRSPYESGHDELKMPLNLSVRV
jgi:hypothetical protein